MMDVARLELCQELSEVSGWKDTYFAHTRWKWSKEKGWFYEVRPTENARDGLNSEFVCPAYDLGYLLRKLPPTISPHITVWPLSIDYNFDGRWMARYAGELCLWADTPEDALCKLAIELFKQNTITKEN